MRNSIFLNSIHIFGLYNVNYEKVFIKNNIISTVNHIRITSDDEADMWSSIIELLTSVGDKPIYPLDSEDDWVIIIVYSIWDTPIDLYNAPLKTIQVKIECINGEIIEEAHEIKNDRYEIIENDNHQMENVSKLNPGIINDIVRLNFYRWNPRLTNLDCIFDFTPYFMTFHHRWYRDDPVGYVEEMESVLHTLREGFEYIKVVVNDELKTFNVYIIERYSQMEIPLEKMDNDFQNFFLSYAEFKKYKDDSAGVMGFYMIDCKSKLYISIFTAMLAGGYQKSNSQFFFMYWEDTVLEKLEKTYISQMDI